ncbi:hypothetical protein GF378_00755 [Candidatus Pacearchaeota archaeon]|nr:hypothetical protein [Candidatus Pacearchaeota archaeon]
MGKEARFFVSGLITLVGAVLILNAFSGMTGFVITEDLGIVASSVFGFAFFIGGLILLAYEGHTRQVENDVYHIVDSYKVGKIDEWDAADRINRLRGGKNPVEGVEYAGGEVVGINTKKRDIPVNVKDQRKALDLMASLYWTSLINNRDNISKSNIKIDREKIPELDKYKGGLTGYLKDKFKEKAKS